MKVDVEEIKDVIIAILSTVAIISFGGAGIGLLLGTMITVLRWFGL